MSKCFGSFKELYKGLFVHGKKVAEFNQTSQMTKIAQTNSGYVEKLFILVVQKPFFQSNISTLWVDSEYHFFMKYR